MATASARLEVRVRRDSQVRLQRAADRMQVPLSDFVRSAAEDRADEVLREHETQTKVPAEFFDALLAALDAPARSNAALVRAARRARTIVSR